MRPTDVFIVLPRGERGTEILQYIRKELPNVSVQDWAFELDGPKVRVNRSGLPQERLVTFMTHRNPGHTYISVIGQEFSLKPPQRKDLQKVLRDENHPTTLALKTIGVTRPDRFARELRNVFLCMQSFLKTLTSNSLSPVLKAAVKRRAVVAAQFLPCSPPPMGAPLASLFATSAPHFDNQSKPQHTKDLNHIVERRSFRRRNAR